jgi:F-box/WD-40 domain protein MET30
MFPDTVTTSFADTYSDHQNSPETVTVSEDVCQDDHDNITLSASSKHAGQTVAPFLARHIPDQYAPGGGMDALGNAKQKDPNTKYCYRHRPDLKCRRQPNEPSMDQLQHELEDLSQGDQQAIAHVWSLFSAAPAKQRNLMLQGILSQCCFPQLSYLSTNVRELIRIDFLTALPPEISFKVLCFLDTTSLCKAAQVSQRWRSLADDDVVWHSMCEQHIDRKCTKCGWGLPLMERKSLRASKRQIQLRATGRGLNEWSPNITPYPEAASNVHTDAANACSAAASSSDESGQTAMSVTLSTNHIQLPTPSIGDVDDSYFRPRTRPWKDVYKDRFRVGTNWKHGRCSTRILKGHTNGVTCLQMCETERLLATGSYDNTIKVWNINSGEEIRTMRGHTSGIRCLQFDSTKLISGSLDGTVKIWNWRTGELLSTLTGHRSGIVGLHFDGEFESHALSCS